MVLERHLDEELKRTKGLDFLIKEEDELNNHLLRFQIKHVAIPGYTTYKALKIINSLGNELSKEIKYRAMRTAIELDCIKVGVYSFLIYEAVKQIFKS